jgi:hypothetical protein
MTPSTFEEYLMRLLKDTPMVFLISLIPTLAFADFVESIKNHGSFYSYTHVSSPICKRSDVCKCLDGNKPGTFFFSNSKDKNKLKLCYIDDSNKLIVKRLDIQKKSVKFEGEYYRNIDKLKEAHPEIFKTTWLKVAELNALQDLLSIQEQTEKELTEDSNPTILPCPPNKGERAVTTYYSNANATDQALSKLNEDWSFQEEDSQFKLNSPETVKKGIISYLDDRRKRGVPITTKDTLFSLVLTDPKSKNWLSSFKSASPLQPKAPRPIAKYSDAISPNRIPATTGEQVEFHGVPGAASVTTQLKIDGSDWYHKVPYSKSEEDLGRRLTAEAAAYQLNALLGLNFVEETKLGKYNGKVGTLQKKIPASFEQGKTKGWDTPKFEKDLSDLRAFDFIGNFQDRHKNNLFFNPTTGEIKAIDHADGFSPSVPLAFPQGYPISGGILPEQYTSKMRAAVAQISYEKLYNKMIPYLTLEQIEATWMRVMIIRQDIEEKHRKVEP